MLSAAKVLTFPLSASQERGKALNFFKEQLDV